MFEGKKVLITGGTGSLGHALTKKILEMGVDTIRIFSRDELKQSQMNSEFMDKRLRFLLGDVRDKERLSRALEDINIVILTAALKRIEAAEYNPFESIKTNVYGSQNLIETCLDRDVESVIAIGTDKAVSPLNTYGATKLLMEKMFVAANFYKGTHYNTKFSCVRYGNVLGSRGSLVPTMIERIKEGKSVTITDPKMTRFNITMNQALDLIFRGLSEGIGGDIFIPKLKAYRVEDMKDAIIDLMGKNPEIEKIPVRPGEKFHETLINKDESRNVYESKNDYIIFDKMTQNYNYDGIPNVKKSNISEQYSSDNVKLLSKEELKMILVNEKLIS